VNLPYISERYAAVSLLGEGGFASVYRAHDRTLRRDVAIKLLKPSVAGETGTAARFMDEASRLARLNHPHIITIYDVGEIEIGPYMTMELIEGLTLAELVDRDGPLPLPQAGAYLRELAGAIDHLHAGGIVHRDLSARNVMLAQDQRIVLMDLGIARDLDSTQQTHSGAILGTPEAMSPEQVRGRPAGPAADIYALGVLTYRMLGGRPPFRGDAIQVMHAHAYEQPPPLRLIRPDLPQRAIETVESALEKDPDSRPSSATAFVANLTGMAVTETAARTQQELQAAGTARQESRQRRTPGVALAAFILVLTVLAGGVAWAAASRRSHANAAATHGKSSAAAAGTAAIVESDDFHDPASGILPIESTNPAFTLGYIGGEYQIAKLDPTVSYFPFAAVPGTFRDGTIAVDARIVGRTGSVKIALECRRRPGDGPPPNIDSYRIEVSPTAGTVTLLREDNGKPSVLATQRIGSIRPGNQSNHVELTCTGSTVEASVNGGPPVTASDDAYQSGQFTLVAAGDLTELPDIRFAHLRITQPSAGP
jgi:hypothetical protein